MPAVPDLELSLVIPAYNEAERIAEPLRSMAAHLGSLPYRSEIVVVDDGSRDATSDRVRATAGELAIPVQLVRYTRNRGKGYALKVGFAAARGERILFSDADLSVPIEQAGRLLRALDEGCDLAIASRKVPGAEIAVHQPWLREQMGRAFSFIVRHSIADVSDVTCGFKAFRGEVGRDLFSRLRIYNWSFDAELLMIAKRRGYRLIEVPVRWEDRAGSKVRLLRDVLSSALGILRILLNQAAGRYDQVRELDLPMKTWSCGAGAAPCE